MRSSRRNPGGIPEEVRGGIWEEVLGGIPEEMHGGMSGRVLEATPVVAPERIPEEVHKGIPKDMLEKYQKKFQENPRK